MAIFSDIDILGGQGKVLDLGHINPLRLTPDSYDVAVGSLREVVDPRVEREILRVYHTLAQTGIETHERLPRFMPWDLKKTEAKVVKPGKVYIGSCLSPIETDGNVQARLVQKSTRSRRGFNAFNPDARDGLVAVVAYANAKVPDTTVAQAIFYERGTEPMDFAALKQAYVTGELQLSNPAMLFDGPWENSVRAHFAGHLWRYDGEVLGQDEDAKHFAKVMSMEEYQRLREEAEEIARARGDFSHGSMFRLYLGITDEGFGTDNSHIGWMYFPHSDIGYPNAPLCHAGVPMGRHTLELSMSEKAAMKIPSRQSAACSVMFYPTKTPSSVGYLEAPSTASRYVNQRVPVFAQL